MPLSSLATVELQLVMRCLDRHSLLRLARCSHTARAAASADFAWQLLSPQSLQWKPCSSPAGEAVARSLLRFCGVHVRWNGEPSGAAYGTDPSTVAERELLPLRMIPRLRGLDLCMERVVPLPLWTALLSDIAALDSFRCNLHSADDRVLDVLLAHHPNLRSLHMRATNFDVFNAELLSPLPLFVHLSSLSIVDYGWDPRSGLREALVRCPALTELHLACLPESVWAPVLTSTAVNKLRSLSLLGLFAMYGGVAGEPASIDVDAIFACMPLLESLSLTDCAGTDHILHALRHGSPLPCGQLRMLRCVQDEPEMFDSRYGAKLPSASALCSLLESRPASSSSLQEVVVSVRSSHGADNEEEEEEQDSVWNPVIEGACALRGLDRRIRIVLGGVECKD